MSQKVCPPLFILQVHLLAIKKFFKAHIFLRSHLILAIDRDLDPEGLSRFFKVIQPVINKLLGPKLSSLHSIFSYLPTLLF